MESFRNGSFRLFRLLGIDVYLHWSWFLIALFQVQGKGRYESQIWNVVEYLSLFAIVTLHEFGHALACRSVGGVARHIILWPLGGVALVRPPARPGAVLWSIAAGPLVNVALVPVTFLLWWTLGGAAVPGPEMSGAEIPGLHRYLFMLMVINLGLLIFNMVPVYPLDGGQIVGALLWFQIGRWRGLQVVSILGVFFGVMLLGLTAILVVLADGAGNLVGAMILGFMAFFIITTSLTAFFQAGHFLHIQSLPRNPDAQCPSCGTHPPSGAFWVCSECQTRFDTFATQGTCPACGGWYLDTACPDCGKISHISRWFREQPHAAAGEALGAARDEPPPYQAG
jgi:Zn-dependent protease